uniref:Uncharacterized protein n=1 Tax=Glossina morsitans morsitans TaxID=37546 RepID=A0A1B0GB47_GLOMM
MSHSSGFRKYDDNECSGPRPPVPGEESRVRKILQMTEGVGEHMRDSPPSYLNWARTFNHLLEDRDGVELFKKFVEEEHPAYNDHLNFYFACEGLKQQTDPEKIKQIIQAMYRFLKKSQLSVSDDLRHTIKAGLKNEVSLSSNIFDSMQKEVEATIRNELYLSFLKSDMYISYIRQMSVVHERCSSSGGPGSCSAGSSSGSGTSCGSNSGGSGAAGDAGACALPLTISNKSTINVCVPTMGPIVNFPANTNVNIGSCSASGSVYGPSTSASSSGSVSATDTLPRSSTLPTLHEDSELSLNDDFEKLRVEAGRGSTELPIRLTRDLLLATQTRRLEIRPPGALGYVYTGKPNTSYVPNSRVDSERASVSSGGRTDSDTMSLSSCSMDGRPYIQRRHGSTESKAIRENAMFNKETNSFQIIPRTQRLHSNEHHPLTGAELFAELLPKLEEVKRQQDMEERARLDHLSDETLPTNERLASDRALAQAIREKFAMDEDNDQDILDQHVSRVWKDQTPHRSPDIMSPCPPLPIRRRTITHDSGMLSDGATSISGIKHSKSMPDHSSSSRKLTSKWPSMNTDSGISLADTLMKYKDNSYSSRSDSSSTASKQEETKRRLEEIKRSHRYTQSQQPASFSNSSSGSSSLHHSGAPPPLPLRPQETTTVVFSFCDEEYPYRSKIPVTQPTLKQFKDYLPKKGNFRFFFRTRCEDPESPVIYEEIVNDSDILPLFEGKVMGQVKPLVKPSD